MSAIEKIKSIQKQLLPDQKESAWDVITDVGYSPYAAGVYRSLPEMVDWLESEYGPIAKLAVLLKNYTSQVYNGGHSQYFLNGYASRESNGCFNMVADEYDIDMHTELIALVREHLDIPLKSKFLEIIEEFEVVTDTDCEECNGTGSVTEHCVECDGNGEIEENCKVCDGTGFVVVLGDDLTCNNCIGGEIANECINCHGSGEITEECHNCDGTGEFTENSVKDSDALDSALYEILDAVTEQSSAFFESLLVD